MNELYALLKLELRSLYGINRHRYTQDQKAKKRYRVLCVAWAVIVLMLFAYVGGLVFGLCQLGLGDIVPAYLTAISSLVILVFGLFQAGNRIFGQKGYDLLTSMPIPVGRLVASRFLSLYLEDLVLTLAILLPGCLVYGICMKPEVWFYLSALAGAVLIPAIPLVISTLFGTLILAVSVRMKRKSLMQSLLSVTLVVAVLVGSFTFGSGAEEFDPAALSELAETVGYAIGMIYPPALWLGAGKLWLFALVSLGVMALAMYAVSANFQWIMDRLRRFSSGNSYKIGSMESRGLVKALYIRELKRYFSSSIYVSNTIIGPILGAILSLALAVMGTEAIGPELGLVEELPGLLPFAVSAVFCMMPTTSVAISMEGRQFWVIKSLPIPTKALLDSKLLVNLTLMAPCYLVSVAALGIGLKPGLMELLWLILIPAAADLFVVVLGITVNLKFHSFDWEKEETVVKQSLPAALGGFAGLLLGFLMAVAALITPPQYGDLLRGALCLALLLGTALLYRRNNRVELAAL